MREAPPLSGEVEPLTFPFVLMGFHHQGATGSLRVDGPAYQKALYFRGGRILFGSSNDPRDQLGAILIENGSLTPEQLEEASSKVGPGSPLAKVLSETGFVSQRELSAAATAKVERILSEILAYTTGSYEFEDGVLPKGAVDLKLSTESVAIAAVRRLSDRSFVLRHLGSLEVVLTPVRERQQELPQGEAFAWELLAQLDGQRTLKEAAAGARLDEFEAAKLACAMLFLGLVERRGETAALEPPLAVVDARVGVNPPRTFELGDAGASPRPPDEQAEIDLSDTMRAAFTSPDTPLAVASAEEVPATTPVLGSGDALREALSLTPATEPPPTRVAAVPSPPPAPEAPPPLSLEVAAKPPATPAIVGYDLRLPTDAPSAPPTAPPPSPAKPAKEELAALDLLFKSRPMEGTRERGQKPAAQAPRPPAALPSGVGPEKPATSGRRWLMGAAAAVALAIGAATGWWFVDQPAPAAPVASPTASVPPTLAPPAPAASPTAAAGAISAVIPPPAEDRLSSARRLMRSGELTASAVSFAAHVRRAPAGTATVQLLVACAPETVQKAVANTGAGELLILPVEYRGRACYRLCWGLYASPARAASSLGALPDYFRQGGATPKVVPAASLLP